MKLYDYEILSALDDLGEASSYQISSYIEDQSPKIPWRFLWWHGESERLIGYGTIYRALDRLKAQGQVRYRKTDDVMPRYLWSRVP